jgi:hypothetical protein
VKRRAAKGDDQRKIVGEALGLELHEQREALHGGIVIEPEPPLPFVLAEHVVERAQAEIRALLVDERRVVHLCAALAYPGDAHPVEQRVQNAEADIHAVDGHAGGKQPLHGDLDEVGQGRIRDAGFDDRCRNVGLSSRFRLVHDPAPCREIVRRFGGGDECPLWVIS